MLELFVIGTFWFWALIVAEIILLFVFIDHENGIGATVSLLIFGACLQWLGNVDILGYVWQNPVGVLAAAAAFFVIGTVWGIIKWWIYCRDRLEDYLEAREKFLENNGADPGLKTMPPEFRSKWSSWLEQNYKYDGEGDNRRLDEAPRARKNKARIMRWMAFWPISMLWSLFDDFVKRVFRTIYQKIAGFLQRIADNMFGKIRDDLLQ
jgi:hypothetical protein